MFHVPEVARLTAHPLLRSHASDGNNGAFELDSVEPGWVVSFIVSDGEGWEHVSVHAARLRKKTWQSRTPTWREMCFVKGLCWDDEDVVMQLHPRRSQYVNEHPHTLHLWRPTGAAIPEPPSSLVGSYRVIDGPVPA